MAGSPAARKKLQVSESDAEELRRIFAKMKVPKDVVISVTANGEIRVVGTARRNFLLQGKHGGVGLKKHFAVPEFDAIDGDDISDVLKGIDRANANYAKTGSISKF